MQDRDWTSHALTLIEADYQRSADTHLVPLQLRAFPHVDLYFKDESTHPSGSLKHRLARSLFLYALCNGWIQKGKTVVEASSGSTAVSEAYFAKLIGVPFVAVMPQSTSQDKIKAIEFYGGKCHYVTHPSEVYEAARQVAQQTGGHYIDQFTYAERATDWRGNNNIAESIFRQMQKEKYPIPSWIVSSAGTGGTSATISRYIRFMYHATQVCVVDPEFSVFYDCWKTNDFSLRSEYASRIEGIGRPQVEPSFIPSIIDRMEKIPDAQSIAAMNILSDLLNRPVGPSTGTNFYGALLLANEMKQNGEKGSIVTLICDSGLRYLNTYYSALWLDEKKLLNAVQAEEQTLKRILF
ncbi:PLP-dependent cysteine synthase family protein [Spirosoma sp. KUDC1026]|uniref:PLP-dependent cysteine synthase family protein n=1 Tax=Spirosoma sp. KUDC1026 TaxID=2745947 RepID=UPI00159B9CA6|nr:PLP-dependent cysteine synthase family protein [Spirosoma sp. KUDC1026]QKZ12995.1 PLP-dependent cysteine synthase family protein [Spirosoma sp. KUDC1026]